MSGETRNAEIHRRWRAGESQTDLAREFGVTPPRVHQITLKGRRREAAQRERVERALAAEAAFHQITRKEGYVAIPPDIVDIVTRRIHPTVIGLPQERHARHSVEAHMRILAEVLTEHGYKITGPTVTEEMVEVYRQGAAMTVPEAAQADWTAMHEAAPATPWESE